MNKNKSPLNCMEAHLRPFRLRQLPPVPALGFPSDRKDSISVGAPMHLWPSLRIRDSFKVSYLKNLERKLHRMKSEKESQQRQGREKLLDDGDDVDREQDCGGKLGLRCLLGCCCELVLIMSCCYCCFGCGACMESDN